MTNTLRTVWLSAGVRFAGSPLVLADVLAHPAFADKEVGTLEVGKLADLAVLSQDIFTAPPETLGKTQVVMTLVGGKTVYDSAP